MQRLEISRWRPLVVLIALLLSGCDGLGELELVYIEPNAVACSINQTRMDCSDVVDYLEHEDRLSHFSRIVLNRKRGAATEAKADEVANQLRDAGFLRVRVDLQSIFVSVDRNADQCSVDRVSVPCANVAVHLRDVLQARLADPIMVSPESGEFMSSITKLVADQLAQAGYVDVVLAGIVETATSQGDVASN